jgi:hypothetical protein
MLGTQQHVDRLMIVTGNDGRSGDARLQAPLLSSGSNAGCLHRAFGPARRCPGLIDISFRPAASAPHLRGVRT